MNPLVNLALSVGETLAHEGGRLLFGFALGRAKQLRELSVSVRNQRQERRIPRGSWAF